VINFSAVPYSAQRDSLLGTPESDRSLPSSSHVDPSLAPALVPEPSQQRKVSDIQQESKEDTAPQSADIILQVLKQSPLEGPERERERADYRRYLTELQEAIAARIAALGSSSVATSNTSSPQRCYSCCCCCCCLTWYQI
jgi:hypothetical protein